MTTEEHVFVARVLKDEGWPKVTNRPSDRGGLTKGGITLQGLSQWRGRPVTDRELVELTDDEAEEIYAKQYLAPYMWIPHPRLRVLLADFAVMAWHDDPIRILQLAVGAEPDGVVGPNTRERVLKALELDSDDLYRRVWAARMRDHFSQAYDKKVRQFLKENPDTQLHNLLGWMNRLSTYL